MSRILLGLLTAVFISGGTPDSEEVDFGRPPPQGLWFSCVRKITVELAGELRAGNLGTQKLRQRSEHVEDFTEKILTVEGGRVTELTRQYYRASTSSEVQTDRMLNPRKDQQEELYSGQDFSVIWKNGEFELRVIAPKLPEEPPVGEAHRIEEPSAAVKAALRDAFAHPGPLFPADGRPRRPGESWKLTADAVNRIMPRRPAHRIRGEMEVEFAALEPDHPVKVSLVDAKRVNVVDRKVRCAVLKARATLRVEPPEQLPMTIEFSGTIHYSLEHRLVVEFEFSGAVRIKGTLDTYAFDHGGSFRDSLRVEIHEPAPAKEEPNEDATGGERRDG